MKFFVFSSAIVLLALGSSSKQCQQGKVANKLSVCIEPQYIQGCLQYQTISGCIQCQKGYKLNKNKCDAIDLVQRQPKINGCLVKDEDKTKCLNCANGFFRKHGTCYQGVKNCIKYKNDQKCTQCKQDYALVLNKCTYNLLLGCKKIKSDHSCSQCWQPFKLKDGHCSIQNCQSVNDYGCVTCLCGFYLDKDKNCQKVEAGCIRYQRGRCINCLDHYKLKGGICQIEGCVKYEQNKCAECKKQYDNDNGACLFKNCVDWSHDKCISCKQGYKNQGGICSKETSFVCTD